MFSNIANRNLENSYGRNEIEKNTVLFFENFLTIEKQRNMPLKLFDFQEQFMIVTLFWWNTPNLRKLDQEFNFYSARKSEN